MSGTLLSACPSDSPLTPKFGCPFAPPSSWPLFPRELFNPTRCSGDYHIYLLMGGATNQGSLGQQCPILQEVRDLNPLQHARLCRLFSGGLPGVGATREGLGFAVSWAGAGLARFLPGPCFAVPWVTSCGQGQVHTSG